MADVASTNGRPRRNPRLREAVAGGQRPFATASWARAQALTRWVDDLDRSFSGIYERMLLDEQVSACLGAFADAVLADGLQVRPAVDDRKHEDYRRAVREVEFAERALTRSGTQPDLWLGALMKAPGLGNVACEVTMEPVEAGPDAGRWSVVQVKDKSRDAYRLVVDPFMNLLGLLAATPGSPSPPSSGPLDPEGLRDDPRFVPRTKWVVHSWEPVAANPQGSSALRCVYEPWFGKREAGRDFILHLHQFGSPYLYAVLGEAAGKGLPATDEELALAGPAEEDPVTAALEALMRFKGGEVGVFGPGTKLDLLQSSGLAQGFLAALDAYDRRIARGILGAIRAVMESQYGSKRDSETAQDVTGNKFRRTKRLLAGVVTWDLFYQLSLVNLGPHLAERLCPRASLSAVEHQDFSKVVAVGALRGVTTPSQDQWFLEQFGFPPPTEEELAEQAREKQQQAQPPGPFGGGGGPFDGGAPFALPPHFTGWAPEPDALGRRYYYENGIRVPGQVHVGPGEPPLPPEVLLIRAAWKVGKPTADPNVRVLSTRQVEGLLRKHGGRYTLNEAKKGFLSTAYTGLTASLVSSGDRFLVIRGLHRLPPPAATPAAPGLGPGAVVAWMLEAGGRTHERRGVVRTLEGDVARVFAPSPGGGGSVVAVPVARLTPSGEEAPPFGSSGLALLRDIADDPGLRNTPLGKVAWNLVDEIDRNNTKMDLGTEKFIREGPPAAVWAMLKAVAAMDSAHSGGEVRRNATAWLTARGSASFSLPPHFTGWAEPDAAGRVYYYEDGIRVPGRERGREKARREKRLAREAEYAGTLVSQARARVEGYPALRAAVAVLGDVFQAAAPLGKKADLLRVLDPKRASRLAGQAVGRALDRQLAPVREAAHGLFGGHAEAVLAGMTQQHEDFARGLADGVREAVTDARSDLKGRDPTRDAPLARLREAVGSLASSGTLAGAFEGAFGGPQDFALEASTAMHEAGWPPGLDPEKDEAQVEARHQEAASALYRAYREALLSWQGPRTREVGFGLPPHYTGPAEDSLGRRYYFREGRRIPGPPAEKADRVHALEQQRLTLRGTVAKGIQAALAQPGDAVKKAKAAARAALDAYRQGGAGAVSKLAVKAAARTAFGYFKKAQARYGTPAAYAMAAGWLGCYAAYALDPRLALLLSSPLGTVFGVAEAVRQLGRGARAAKRAAGFSLDLDAPFAVRHAARGGEGGHKGGQFLPAEAAPAELVKTTAPGDNEGGRAHAPGQRASPEEYRRAVELARRKLQTAPVPSEEEAAKARAGMDEVGANAYRKRLVGNKYDREARRKKLLKEFGDGEKCPCIYCATLVTHGTLEQDKIYTTAQGGKYRVPNLVPACSGCNKYRGARPFAEVIEEVAANV